MAYPQRPLLIILSDETPDTEQADLTLAPGRIGAELKGVLRLRQEALRIFEQQQAAEQQITRLQEELANAKRIRHELEVLKNAIVRNVSHELRTPLLQIKSAVALLHEEVDEEKKTQLVALATNSTARLEVLVRNITMLGGSLETSSGPIILHDAMEAARRNLRRLWEHRDQTHRIQAEIPTSLPPVLADKQGISIVLQLLIDNALKFSQAAIYVETELIEDNEFVEVRVRDSGIGIARDQLDRIFEIFYQVDSSSTRAYGGMGVGLAIVRLILENHHVSIKVKSELGKGSIFSFKLPVVRL